MNIQEFVADKMREFDAMPEKASIVWLNWPKTSKISFADGKELNRLLEKSLRERGVEVKFRKPQKSKLDLAFVVRHSPTPGIGWAVLERPSNE